MQQDQFLNVVELQTAHRQFANALHDTAIPEELVRIESALGRVLTRAITAPINVPQFDRSNFDGFAVVASDTFNADEINPIKLTVLSEKITPGAMPDVEISTGKCVSIATGAMLPRGANAVLMIEHTDHEMDADNDATERILVSKAVAPGEGISFCGSDIAKSQIVFNTGRVMTNRETAVLAGLGIDRVFVRKKPRVAIISTGDELVSPGNEIAIGEIFDANSRMLADRIHEIGGDAIELGIVRDDFEQLHVKIEHAIEIADLVILSGGTSKGQGDLCYRAIKHWDDPGIVVHGVALKPGKPVCLAVTRNKPVVILPGFPASARFTFDEFVGPLLQKWSGGFAQQTTIGATLKSKVNSSPGRAEYVLVGMLKDDIQDPESDTQGKPTKYIALPLSRDSGSISTYARADGYIKIPSNREFSEADETVDVIPIVHEDEFADLVLVGSHCVHVDRILELCESNGIRTRYFHVGSTGGLLAAQNNACDIATIHLQDPTTGKYNQPFVDEKMELVEGYTRNQGIVFRGDDKRFAGKTAAQIIDHVKSDSSCLMINRNPGSGTRVFIDKLLNGIQPAGYFNSSTNHTAVVSAIEQRRADWGIAIEDVVKLHDSLAFMPIADEQFDFIIPKSRMKRKPIQAFLAVLELYKKQTTS